VLYSCHVWRYVAAVASDYAVVGGVIAARWSSFEHRQLRAPFCTSTTVVIATKWSSVSPLNIPDDQITTSDGAITGDEFHNVNVGADIIVGYADRYSIHPDCSFGYCDLVIRDVQTNDAGSYCCYDDGGRGARQCSELTVFEHGPTCSNNAANNGIVTGNSCDIPSHVAAIQHTCFLPFFGNKPPTLMWKDGRNNTLHIGRIDSNGRNVSAVVMMNLHEVMAPREIYTCETTVSKVPCTSIVRHQFAFNSVSGLSSLDAYSGTVPCVANVSDNLVCTYQWVKSEDGEVIQDGTTLDLSAPQVIPGAYQCIADCVINGHQCRVSATKVHYTRLEDLKQNPVLVAFVVLAIVLVLLLVSGVFYMRYRLRSKSFSKDIQNNGSAGSNGVLNNHPSAIGPLLAENGKC
jgi:hypothetical protein